MTLFEDKFKIIKNNYITMNLEEYIENDNLSLINKIELPSAIHNFIWFNNNNINNDDIYIIINNYLNNKRIIFRQNIKKNNFTLNNLNLFLKNIIHKLKFISNISNNKFVFTDQLNNLIISDSIILLFLENQIIKFNELLKNEFDILLKILLEYNEDIYNKMISIILISLNANYIKTINVPLPNNLINISILSENINYYNKIINYYTFIENKKLINISNIIIDNLLYIINNNSMTDTLFVFNNLWINIDNIIIIYYKLDNIYINFINKIFKTLMIKFNNIDNFNIIMDIFINVICKKYNIYKCYQFVNDIINIIYNKYLNEYIDYIDNLIINNSNLVILSLNWAFSFSNKTTFIDLYYKKLLKRLIIFYNTNNLYLYKEEQYIIELGKYYNNINKLIRLIKDIKYLNYNNINENIKILIITNSWNLNPSLDNFIINNSLLNNYLIPYEEKYNKNIIWLPHYGEINIIYLNIRIKMLPIQFIIFELFTISSEIILNDIINHKILLNYDIKFKKNIINSLIISKLLLINNNNIILNKQPTFQTDLIDIFINNLNYLEIKENINNNKILELSFSYKEIICSNINSILKLNNLNYNSLLINIQNTIKLFTINDNIFQDAINYMINMDYITINNDIYIKIKN